MNIELMTQKMEEFFASEEGKKSIQEFAEKLQRRADQAKKFGDFLASKTYEERLNLLQRAAAKHDDRWNNLCYSRGHEPHPWNIMYPVFEAAQQFGEEYDYKEGPLDDFDAHFGAYTKAYLGFYFNWIHGQGTVLRIFDKNKKEIFSS